MEIVYGMGYGVSYWWYGLVVVGRDSYYRRDSCACSYHTHLNAIGERVKSTRIWCYFPHPRHADFVVWVVRF